MSGLVDSDTGLAFGTALNFQDAIGGAGLIVTTSAPSPLDLYWGTDVLYWGTDDLQWG